MPALSQRKIELLYDQRVGELVKIHAKLEDSPLVLAIRYAKGSLDVSLLEIVEDFPGTETDLPLVTEFEASAQFVIMGKLYLTLASPKQIRHAAALARSNGRTSETKTAKQLFAAVRRDGNIVYSATTPPMRKRLASLLAKELALP